VYYWIVSRLHEQKDRIEFDRALEYRPLDPVNPVPWWWTDEDEAARDALAAARALGFRPDQMMN